MRYFSQFRAILCLSALIGAAAARADDNAIRSAATFYASFDEAVSGDFGGGILAPGTRYGTPGEPGKYVFEGGYNKDVYKIDAKAGVHGGALQATDVLPKSGRIYFPAAGNIAFNEKGWGGTVSLWINTDPNKSLKTPFCDPVQFTEKGAGNGGLWIDFPDVKPRDMRVGAFSAVAEGQKPVPESDPAAPLITLKNVGFKVGEWHHLAITWKNLDTGKPDALVTFYVDGKAVGSLKDRAIAMGWKLDKAGLYVAVNYIGLLDDFAVFNRPLSSEEVGRLKAEPGLLAALKAKKQAARASAEMPQPPKFPFDGKTAAAYQAACAKALGVPVKLVDSLGMEFELVPPGKFLMGSPRDEPGHNANGHDETQYEVTLTRPFYLSRYETTVAQFRRFVEDSGYKTDGEKNGGGHAHDAKAEWKHRDGTNWKKPGFAGPYEMSERHPVVHVSHADSLAFCTWVQKRSGRSDMQYDLPTEAEWEWACRAGSGERFSWGSEEDASGKRINCGDLALKKAHPHWPRAIMQMNDGHAFCAPVGSYEANGFGLCDMLGNVWEFCSTRSGPPPKGPVTDPADLDEKRGFAVRGGGWSNVPADCRSAVRNADPPHFCHSNLGFRVALKLPKVK
jgi:sulfatase modifying factor 1